MPEAAAKLYAPLSCGDGLLLLCRGLRAEIHVANPFTGFHATIVRPDGLVPSHYVLRSCHGAQPNSFQVVAVELSREGIRSLQNYSSETGAWGPVLHPDADDLRFPWPSYYRAAPPVCRGAVHLLCSISNNAPDYSPGDERYLTHTVAANMTTGRARVTRLPKQCSMRDEDVSCKRVLMLATSEDDRLSLVRREEASLEVSVWLYVGDHGSGGGPEKSGWLLRRSIDIRKLIEEA